MQWRLFFCLTVLQESVSLDSYTEGTAYFVAVRDNTGRHLYREFGDDTPDQVKDLVKSVEKRWKTCPKPPHITTPCGSQNQKGCPCLLPPRSHWKLVLTPFIGELRFREAGPSPTPTIVTPAAQSRIVKESARILTFSPRMQRLKRVEFFGLQYGEVRLVVVGFISQMFQ